MAEENRYDNELDSVVMGQSRPEVGRFANRSQGFEKPLSLISDADGDFGEQQLTRNSFLN
jgi:hypothetical protein